MVELNNRIGKPPCYSCEERTAGCHSKCQQYIEWKQEFQKRKKNDTDLVWLDYKMLQYLKAKRGK